MAEQQKQLSERSDPELQQEFQEATLAPDKEQRKERLAALRAEMQRRVEAMNERANQMDAAEQQRLALRTTILEQMIATEKALEAPPSQPGENAPPSATKPSWVEQKLESYGIADAWRYISTKGADTWKNYLFPSLKAIGEFFAFIGGKIKDGIQGLGSGTQQFMVGALDFMGMGTAARFVERIGGGSSEQVEQTRRIANEIQTRISLVANEQVTDQQATSINDLYRASIREYNASLTQETQTRQRTEQNYAIGDYLVDVKKLLPERIPGVDKYTVQQIIETAEEFNRRMVAERDASAPESEQVEEGGGTTEL